MIVLEARSDEVACRAAAAANIALARTTGEEGIDMTVVEAVGGADLVGETELGQLLVPVRPSRAGA